MTEGQKGVEPKPAFSHEDWLSIFDDAEREEEGDSKGALTKVEIMELKGWSHHYATKTIHEYMRRGLLTWVRIKKEYCGVMQIVTAYAPTAKQGMTNGERSGES